MSLNFELHLNDLRRESVYFGDRILNRLRHTITEGDFILGEDTQLFERDFAKYI